MRFMRMFHPSLLLCTSALFGCTGYGPGPKSIAHPDPAVKIPAIVQAAENTDHSSADELVKELESGDPAVRLFAIEALERLTGETFDYRYYDDPEQRKPAVLRWQQWIASQGAKSAADQP